MGITEWPGGQWITAGVYWSNEVSNSKLLLIGQGMQTMFFNKSTKLRGLITSQLQQFKNTFDSNRKYIFIKSSIVMTLWQLFCLLRHKYQCACWIPSVTSFTLKLKVEKMVCSTGSYVSCYAYIYSSKHIFWLCITLSCISSKKYSNLFWHILSLYQ